MSLAWYKTVLESVTNHEQSAAESSTVMVQTQKLLCPYLADYIVGPPNLLVLLTVNHVAAELLRLVRTSRSDTMELPGEGTYR